MADTTEEVSREVRAIADSVFPQQKKKGEEHDEPSTEEIKVAFQRLEALGQPAFDVVARRLRRGLNDPVGRLLAAVGKPAVKYIEYTMGRGDVEEQCGAIKVIGSLEIPVPSMLKSILWSDIDDRVRWTAAYQLLIKDNEGLDIVTTALSNDDPKVRLAAVGALYTVVTAPEDRYELDRYEPLIELLSQVLDDPDEEVRERATRALQIIERLPMDAIDAALDDESMEIRRIGLLALFATEITSERPARLVARAIEDKRREIAKQTVDLITAPRGDIDYELLTNVVIDELVLRDSGRPDEYFNSSDVAEAIKRAFQRGSRVLGLALQRLCDIAYEHHDSARRRSVLVAAKVNRDEFVAMVNERAEQDPSAAQAIRQMLGIGIDANALIQQLSATDPSDIQGIAATQIGLLEQYYQGALDQAKTSFRWATGAMAIGLLCLIASLVYLLLAQVWNVVLSPVKSYRSHFNKSLEKSYHPH